MKSPCIITIICLKLKFELAKHIEKNKIKMQTQLERCLENHIYDTFVI